MDEVSGDARASDLPRYVENLHRVERDMRGVDETEIELLSWIPQRTAASLGRRPAMLPRP